MAKGFWNGILTGGILGAVVAMFVSPQMKPSQKRDMVNKGKKMQAKASRVIREVKGSVKSIKKILN